MENNKNILVRKDRELDILTNYLVNNNTPNSLILIGDRGIGLRDIAISMATCLVNKKMSHDFESIKNLLLNNNHFNSPFLLLIEKIWLEDKKRFKNKIYREDLTYIDDFFSTKDEHNQKRVCVIDSIDDLSNDGVNSLLKIIEEPNQNSHFIIINYNQKSLIPTIRSRSQIVRFKSANKDYFFSSIKKDFINLQKEDVDNLYNLSKGSIDFSKKYLDYNFREMEDHLESILLEPENIRPNTAHHYINFVKNNIDSNDEMDSFFIFIELKINKLSVKACAEKNKNLLNRLIKNYYEILKIKNKYLTFNLSFDQTIIAYFYLLKNA